MGVGIDGTLISGTNQIGYSKKRPPKKFSYKGDQYMRPDSSHKEKDGNLRI
jgi:hypothetical protein